MSTRHALEGGPRPVVSDLQTAEDVSRDITDIIEGIRSGDLEHRIPSLRAKGWTFDSPFWDFYFGGKDGRPV